MDRIDQPRAQHSPRALAVHRAAQAADAHAAAGADATTLQALAAAVQGALNLGATFADIRAARRSGR